MKCYVFNTTVLVIKVIIENYIYETGHMVSWLNKL